MVLVIALGLEPWGCAFTDDGENLHDLIAVPTGKGDVPEDFDRKNWLVYITVSFAYAFSSGKQLLPRKNDVKVLLKRIRKSQITGLSSLRDLEACTAYRRS